MDRARTVDNRVMEAASLHPGASQLPLRALRRASDDRLVDAVRAGDPRAFELVYDRHHRGLLAFCRHMLGSREEAEDALQHVFLSAHRHLLSGPRDIQLKAWLYAIARNRCLSILRARRETVAMDDVREPSTDGLAVADAVQHRQDLADMLSDLGRLPDDQRAALVLAEIGDLSHDEIDTALEVRKDKVKALIFQARESLGAYRRAREADCHEIQEQLATASGSALRRAALRRHVSVCPACTAFETEVSRQRQALALLLPVVPTFALKNTILSGVLGGGTAGAPAPAPGVAGAGAAGATATGATAGVAGAGGAAAMAAKVIAVVAIATGSAGGGYAVVKQIDEPAKAPGSAPAATPRKAPAASHPATAGGGVSTVAHTVPATSPGPAGKGHGKAKGRGRHGPATAPGQPVRAATPGAGRGRSGDHGRSGTAGSNGKATGQVNG